VIVIDTHVLVWAMQDDRRLGVNARHLLEMAAGEDGLHVSAITPWEIAMLAHKGRLALGREPGAWIDAALALPGVRPAPLAPAVAVDSVRLPGDLHADPADRIIIATARHLGVPLLTADKALLRYGAVGHAAVLDASA
jgi:PIN domain nuclease of toxin-antitoxin system